MGLEVHYSANDAGFDLRRLSDTVRDKVADQVEKAAEDIAATIATLAPMKTGTLEGNVYYQSRTRSYRIWIDLNARVPGTKRTTVGDYAHKIEAGNFNQLGKGSIYKESTLNRRSLAGKRVEKSSFGTYVGDQFFARAVDATMPKWERLIAKTITDAIQKLSALSQLRRAKAKAQKRDARGRFA